MKSKDFEVPPNTTYLAGMSLGCLPRLARLRLHEEIDVWSSIAVEGHSPALHPLHRSWYHQLESQCNSLLARTLLGAEKSEVAVMGELTANLNMLFVQFYKPTATRYKVLMERGPFPSDQFMVEGQVERCGFDAKEAIIYIDNQDSEDLIISTEKVIEFMDADPAIYMVFLGGVNYYTGQLHDIHEITKAAHSRGIISGWDLAHAVGNVPLQLHDWQVDFASWCSYKYVNSGPGGISGIFIHTRHHDITPVFRGWWGSDRQFGDRFMPLPGALRFVQSNPSVLCLSILLGSLQQFESFGDITSVRRESFRMCQLFRELTIVLIRDGKMKIVTPTEYERSGAQLTLLFPKHNHKIVFDRLRENNIVTDTRHEAIRVAFIALYNDDDDVKTLSRVLHEILV